MLKILIGYAVISTRHTLLWIAPHNHWPSFINLNGTGRIIAWIGIRDQGDGLARPEAGVVLFRGMDNPGFRDQNTAGQQRQNPPVRRG